MNVMEQWQMSLARCGLDDSTGRVFAELDTLYGERHRKYHNLHHVLECLRILEAHPVPGADLASLAIAFWFHDAIYSPLKGGNEFASAELASERLKSMGASEEFRQKVHRLIMATLHDADPRDADEAVMIDVDLSILGGPQSEFEVYESSIRAEYRLVPGMLFRRKRKRILQSFLARPAIYFTDMFRDLFETTARTNLQWAISRL